MIVKGRYSKRPPNDLLRLFTVSTDGNRCWPQTIAKIDTDGTWSGVVYLGGTKPNYEIKIVAALIGQSTRLWWNYYKNVGHVLKEEAPNVKKPIVEGLPPDVVVQGAIYVTRVFEAGQRWDEQRLFDKMRQKIGARELEIAQQIFEWMRKDGRALQFGVGREKSGKSILFFARRAST